MVNACVGENRQLLKVDIDFKFEVEGEVRDGGVGDADVKRIFICFALYFKRCHFYYER